jgi:hypothetical protein
MWISLDDQCRLRRLAKRGQVASHVPQTLVGVDNEGNYRSVAFVELPGRKWAFTKSGMRNQQFPAPTSELLSQITICDLSSHVHKIIAGISQPDSESLLRKTLEGYTTGLTRTSSMSSGRWPCANGGPHPVEDTSCAAVRPTD